MINIIYVLEDEKNERYVYNISFINVKNPPEQGNFIFWSEKNCTDWEERNTLRTYGTFTTEGYGRIGEKTQDVDFIVVVTENDMYLFQRYYG
ncbi:MAG: hypothetical protein K2G63_00040 [Oscillospiraceae bacterium]|nr:hypothetical protein [Oscillospiraceae bacterium]